MLNILNIKIKSVIKHIPNNISSINSKIVIYLGLVAYWGLILVGTFLNI
jgi:hypothetical protein